MTDLECINRKMLKFTTENEKKNAWDATAYNKRFYESGGVTPQKMQCVIASTSPAASSVASAFAKPPPRYKQWQDSDRAKKRTNNSKISKLNKQYFFNFVVC